jgi:hypothetical protein
MLNILVQQGKWVLEERDDSEGQALKFVVSEDVAEDKWKT